MSLCVVRVHAGQPPDTDGRRPGGSTGQTGQAISISGLFAFIASLLVTTITGRFNHKAVLLSITVAMLVSLFLVAAAPNFTVLLLGRALLGLCIGAFWALAVMYGGQAIASAFAAPLGSYLGGIFGWRDVFWALTPIVAANLI